MLGFLSSLVLLGLVIWGDVAVVFYLLGIASAGDFLFGRVAALVFSPPLAGLFAAFAHWVWLRE